MTTTPSLNDPLRPVRRGLRVQRWTTVIATAGTGVVVVSLAARLGPASTAAAAALSGAALVLALSRAVGADRRWRRATQLARQGRTSVREER